MGDSERGWIQMAKNPKSNGDHINALIKGWEKHAADATFSGLTLAQFKTKVKASLDTRVEIENLERELNGLRVDRDNADVLEPVMHFTPSGVRK